MMLVRPAREGCPTLVSRNTSPSLIPACILVNLVASDSAWVVRERMVFLENLSKGFLSWSIAKASCCPDSTWRSEMRMLRSSISSSESFLGCIGIFSIIGFSFFGFGSTFKSSRKGFLVGSTSRHTMGAGCSPDLTSSAAACGAIWSSASAKLNYCDKAWHLSPRSSFICLTKASERDLTSSSLNSKGEASICTSSFKKGRVRKDCRGI
mmetsp:Transcript_13216/g.20614  ORF Transcript_13216/g.20614 Transcript_13216/m.20614 type:complete len:209 (+) Transcript_13216:230-856(+)